MSRSQTLLDDEALEASSVVAHRFMNRERVLRGPNGYARELGLDPLDHLLERLEDAPRVSWLDLCCGSARALVEAAELARDANVAERMRIVGIDLAGRFSYAGRGLEGLELLEASVHRHRTVERYDLITCVHGLHYVGDKLGLVARACGWLKDDGVLVATLDLSTLRVGEAEATRQIAKLSRAKGLEVDTRRHRVRCDGRRELAWPWTYLGADDRGGPSFTGEAAVISHYR